MEHCTKNPFFRVVIILVFFLSFTPFAFPQEKGNIKGSVTDENDNPVPFANIVIEGTTMGAASDVDGSYMISNINEGVYSLKASAIGYKTQIEQVTVEAGETVAQDFTLNVDALNLSEVVVTGTITPRAKLTSTVAVSTITPREIERANPRSTTEVLRYVPGFTRVESSGGAVNQNISIRGILGVEYVMFMEDELPVFPTMHTFFMNADNLFRIDENVENIEVIRGGSSALFGSNTPGAIVNIINKKGGPELRGTIKATAGTESLARYDFNLNGPLAETWRFNLGGFYRYDGGVRDPGFPGIAGGQIKGSITKLLDNGYARASIKIIDDRNQFILPLPFRNPDDPDYVDGFSDYGAMNTLEGDNISVPLPNGDKLNLPLHNGLKTQAYWITADIGFDFEGGWNIQNAAQIMQNDQEWNAILPFDVMSAEDYINSVSPGAQLFYTNHFDADGNKLPFNTPNGLVAPGGEWHIEKPISAFQNQFQVKKSVGDHHFSLGLYFANYTQTNRWYFTDILMDVRDNPRFLDLIAISPTDTTHFTQNGFRRFLSNYTNGDGTTTIFSPVIGAQLQLTDRLIADVGFRYEWNSFFQTSENTSTVDLDGDPATAYDIEPWGNGTYRHFSRTMDDWAGSVGLNYKISDRFAVYVQGSRAYKMPALDEFLNANAQSQVALFESRESSTFEGGVKFSGGQYAFTVNGFWTQLLNNIGQGLEVDPATGQTFWAVRVNPDSRSTGVEIEAAASPIEGLRILGVGTFLSTESVEPGGSAFTAGGVPSAIGNLSLNYATQVGLNFVADWHFVGNRDIVDAQYDTKTQTYIKYEDVGDLAAYHYMNLGVTYQFPGEAIIIFADLLNVYQSKGLEEGNPRLIATGGNPIFLARPILPRRFTLAVQYRF